MFTQGHTGEGLEGGLRSTLGEPASDSFQLDLSLPEACWTLQKWRRTGQCWGHDGDPHLKSQQYRKLGQTYLSPWVWDWPEECRDSVPDTQSAGFVFHSKTQLHTAFLRHPQGHFHKAQLYWTIRNRLLLYLRWTFTSFSWNIKHLLNHISSLYL